MGSKAANTKPLNKVGRGGGGLQGMKLEGQGFGMPFLGGGGGGNTNHCSQQESTYSTVYTVVQPLYYSCSTVALYRPVVPHAYWTRFFCAQEGFYQKVFTEKSERI